MSCEGDKHFFLNDTCILHCVCYYSMEKVIILRWRNTYNLEIQNLFTKYKIPDQVWQERNRNFCGHYMWFLCRLFCKCTGNSPHHMHA